MIVGLPPDSDSSDPLRCCCVTLSQLAEHFIGGYHMTGVGLSGALLNPLVQGFEFRLIPTLDLDQVLFAVRSFHAHTVDSTSPQHKRSEFPARRFADSAYTGTVVESAESSPKFHVLIF